ncbi:MAG: zinc-ribbon domain-containing protein [Clostridia bacterium]|nr:zinc-ribbon domain-containing protein [Clostridia bacterium]
MFCQNCGTYLEDGVKFCPSCGTPVAVPAAVKETVAAQEPVQPVEEPAAQPVYEQPAQPVYQQPVYQQPEAPVYQEPVVKSNPAAEALSTPILIFGILGIAFACIPYINFMGIIFSAIANGKVKAFLAEGGVLAGKAKVGSTLAKVGMILGIIFTIIFAIVIIGLIIAAFSNSGYRNW